MTHAREARAATLLVAFRDDLAMSEEDESDAGGVLRNAMPRDSMILHLRDWDLHIEDGGLLSDDWIREAAFGGEDSVAWCADELVDVFIEKCNEYDIDYDQHADPEGFRVLIQEAASAFVRQWRSRLKEFHPSLPYVT